MSKFPALHEDMVYLQFFFTLRLGHEKIGDDKQKYDFTSDN